MRILALGKKEERKVETPAVFGAGARIKWLQAGEGVWVPWPNAIQQDQEKIKRDPFNSLVWVKNYSRFS